ncbi:HlyD family efflux transporter periplasmic adaptor subunit [Candidatus Entotheonella palauensis]|uniref:HlyD family efflux transporter periplasmic adaptor subunit n=1 Tax=Candidatus Entotheonella palauensis TaxID=93172 RepID=UPI0015C4B81F|nr:HlyD family efflux transporter periplasmic adaptor subunit [Candidatus Entotheonella palauensis]
MKRFGLSLVLTAVIAGIFLTYAHVRPGSQLSHVALPQPDRSGSPPFELAHQPPVKRHRVAALGRLVPEGKIIDIGVTGSERLGRLLVKEGQSVTKGDELAYLESREERLAETAYAQASIAEANMRLKQLREVPLLDIRAQEAQVRRLEVELAGAVTDLNRFEGLNRKGTISQQEVDHQRLQVRRLREEINQTTAILAKHKAEYETNLSLAQASLKTARTNLKRVQASLQLNALKQNLALSQARLARSVLRAPIDGRILQILTHPGEPLAQKPLLKMANTKQMYAIAEVYETDIGLVRIGQRAHVSSPALPQMLNGHVAHIGSTIGKNDLLSVDPVAPTDTRVVEVKIRLDQSEAASRLLNLQVDVIIDLLPSNRSKTMAGH